jgi:hypothetical protein
MEGFVVNFIKVNAKSIVVPFVAAILALLRWVSDNAGVDVIVDNEALTNVLATIIIALAVWWTRNKPRKEPVPEVLRDRGQSGMNILIIAAVIIFIICAFVWLSNNR